MNVPWPKDLVSVTGYIVVNDGGCSDYNDPRHSYRIEECQASLVKADDNGVFQHTQVYPTREAAQQAGVERAQKRIEYHRKSLEASEDAVRRFSEEERLP